MAASQAERVIASGLGGVIVLSDTLSGPASHDGFGKRLVFVPEAGDMSDYAIDVESKRSDMPPEIAARFHAHTKAEAFLCWTELEVKAKLSNIPVLLLLKGPENGNESVVIERADTQDYWIALGKRV